VEVDDRVVEVKGGNSPVEASPLFMVGWFSGVLVLFLVAR
jgi:hypothetical protein